MGHFTLLRLACLAAFLSLSGARYQDCPNYWFPTNGLCYYFVRELRTWDDAEIFCRQFQPDCHLASIHSDEDLIHLHLYIAKKLIGRGHVWIGLRDTTKNYNWEWTDGSETDFIPWKDNQPDHFENKEFCVEMVDYTEYRQWNDEDCAALRPFLCQCRY